LLQTVPTAAAAVAFAFVTHVCWAAGATNLFATMMLQAHGMMPMERDDALQ
jgi:hypothetical protein